MMVRITVPEANMGDVMGDLNTRRARIQGMETEKGHSVVTATVPLAEMLPLYHYPAFRSLAVGESTVWNLTTPM